MHPMIDRVKDHAAHSVAPDAADPTVSSAPQAGVPAAAMGMSSLAHLAKDTMSGIVDRVRSSLSPDHSWEPKSAAQHALGPQADAIIRQSQDQAQVHKSVGAGEKAVSVFGGTAEAGEHGVAIAPGHGKATAGDFGTAIAGDGGTAISGRGGTSIVGEGSMSLAIVGPNGTAAAGEGGRMMFMRGEGEKDLHATVGEKGIRPGKPYHVENNAIVAGEDASRKVAG